MWLQLCRLLVNPLLNAQRVVFGQVYLNTSWSLVNADSSDNITSLVCNIWWYRNVFLHLCSRNTRRSLQNSKKQISLYIVLWIFCDKTPPDSRSVVCQFCLFSSLFALHSPQPPPCNLLSLNKFKKSVASRLCFSQSILTNVSRLSST